jgi:undecaprenyl-diphosphatase
VSSSGHLAITQKFFGLGAPIMFDLLVHIATLIVILGVFSKDIIAILRAIVKWDIKSKEFKWGLYIILANIPVLLVGYFFRTYAEAIFTNMIFIGIAFLFTGTLLFFSNWRKITAKVGIFNSIIIGISQALALFPGISRSGSTISTATLQGVSREDAVRFSFLIAIPAFVGAILLNIGNVTAELISTPYIAGFLTALVVGYFSLKLLINLVIKKQKFHYFAYYCWALGILVLILA